MRAFTCLSYRFFVFLSNLLLLSLHTIYSIWNKPCKVYVLIKSENYRKNWLNCRQSNFFFFAKLSSRITFFFTIFGQLAQYVISFSLLAHVGGLLSLFIHWSLNTFQHYWVLKDRGSSSPHGIIWSLHPLLVLLDFDDH